MRSGRGSSRGGRGGGFYRSPNSSYNNNLTGQYTQSMDNMSQGSYTPTSSFGSNVGMGYAQDNYQPSYSERKSRAQREQPTRTLFVRNIAYDVSQDLLEQQFRKYGEIKKVFNLIDKRGMAFISYYDLRHADAAKREMQDFELGGRKIDVHYSLPKEDSAPKDEDEKNKGTLFVTIREPTEEFDNVALKKLFEQWGDIKEVRDCTGNPTQKFVECWNLKDSAKIVQEKQGVLFAGGYLDIKFAYHNTPRSRNDRRGSNERGGPIRGSFSQRQTNRNQSQYDPNGYNQYNTMGSYGLSQSPENNIPQSTVLNQVAQLATFLNPSAINPNLQQNQAVQQLAYLLQLQQQLNQNQQRNPIPPTNPSQIRM